ncbi:hypothetical protein HY463_01585 [Candidatus Peregrinibacteria bacterium]|nr:hypothetical protein [Candidatus Peregrinibacteria bacterium]
MNFQDLKIIIGQIKKKIACLECKTKYSDEDIEMIGSLGDELTFFYAVCPNCDMEAVINVNIETAEMLTPRLERLGSAPRGGKIESNEILDMHNFLKDFNGNFIEAFKEKNPKPNS